MRRPGIRVRMLAATVLPAILVALALSAILLDRQFRGLDDAMQARVRAEARQLASAAEFGVFAGNREALLALVRAAQASDQDIFAVTVLDAHGVPLVAAGASTLKVVPDITWEDQVSSSADTIVAVIPIRRTSLPVDDIYSGVDPREPSGLIDGFVVIEMSRRGLNAERNRQLMIGIGITLAGLLLATWLALRLARGMVRPVLHIGDVVERIGQGDMTARVATDPDGVMPSLEEGINALVKRIGITQEYLLGEIDAATAELRERKEEAERDNAAKTRFVAAASHDLRQPLQALGLFASRLAALPHAPEVRSLVDNLDASVQALQDLLDTVLDISRLDAGLVTSKPTNFPLEKLFRRMELEFAGPAQQRHVELRVRPSDLWLLTDPGLLERILMNFVSNALRYTATGGVLLACRRRRDHALIQVWDTGIGIPEDRVQEIFSEYVQLGNPERHHAKGLGLGLAICDRLAQLLRLPLGVRSVVGQGSVFWIEVPLGHPEAIAATENASAMAGSRIEGTVAVIEDVVADAASLMGLVAGWGCTAIGASSPAEAIALCEREGVTPDMVITDYRLPGSEDGISAGMLMRRRYGQIPVLLVSADTNERLVAGAARRRFAMLAKPVRPGKLRAIVQQMLAPDEAAQDDGAL